ncbi:MAG: hypothetical protein AAFR59_03670 [Bacteroidota bacterium]
MKWTFTYLFLLILGVCPYIPLPFLPDWGITWVQIAYLSLPKVCLFFTLLLALVGRRRQVLFFCIPLLMVSAIFPHQLRHYAHHLIMEWNNGKSIKETQNIFPGTRMFINKSHTTFNWNLGTWDAYEELVYHPNHGQKSKMKKSEIIEVLDENWYIRKANLDYLE